MGSLWSGGVSRADLQGLPVSEANLLQERRRRNQKIKTQGDASVKRRPLPFAGHVVRFCH